MSLFDDPGVRKVYTQALYAHAVKHWGWGSDEYDSVVNGAEVTVDAALAALPREELVEKFAHAYTQSRNAPPYSFGGTHARHMAAVEAGFAAIGLIPEHVTPTDDGSLR